MSGSPDRGFALTVPDSLRVAAYCGMLRSAIPPTWDVSDVLIAVAVGDPTAEDISVRQALKQLLDEVVGLKVMDVKL